MMHVTATPKRRPTFDELYAEIQRLPEHLTGQILQPGVLSTMSRPGRAHEKALGGCTHALRGRFDRGYGGKGWWILQEYEVRLPGDTLVVPDLAGWRVERVAELPDENPLTLVPDWCAEVLSPSSAQSDRALKLQLYARVGVSHVWLVDPSLRLVEVFESVGERPVLVASARDDEAPELAPFPGAFSLSQLWLRPSDELSAAPPRP